MSFYYIHNPRRMLEDLGEQFGKELFWMRLDAWRNRWTFQIKRGPWPKEMGETIRRVEEKP